MLLQLVKRLALLLNHVAVREGEVVHTLNRLQALVILLALHFLVFQDLVGYDEGVSLVCLVLSLVLELFAH